jgi:PAS domain S-box-containing protein
VEDITERKRAEETLRENEEKLRVLFEQLPIGVSLLDKNRKVMYVNPALEKILDISKDDLLQEKHQTRRYIRPDGTTMPPEEFASVRAFKEQKLVRDIEIGVITESGKTIWTSVSAAPFPMVDEGLLIVTADITERKRAEKELKKSEEKYRSIFENVQDVYYETSFEGTILEVSPSIEFISKEQYRRADLIGRSMYDFYSDIKDRDALIAAIQKTGSVTDFEVRLKNRDGSLIPCSISSKFIFDAQGKPEKIIGSMHDISERKQAEEALRESETRYRSVLQSATDAIVTADSSGIIIGWNSGAERIFGCSYTEAVGQPLTSIMPLYHNAEHPNGMKRLQSGGDQNIIGKTVELEGLRKDKSVFPIELSLSTWEAKSGQFFTGIIRDITERKRAEMGLLLSKQRWENTFDAIADIVCVISQKHEFIAINDAGVQSLKLPRNEIVGRKCFELVHGTKEPLAVCPCNKSLRSGNEGFSEYEQGGKHYSLHAWPIRDDSGKIMSFVHIVKDITERKRAEEKNIEQARLLEIAIDTIIVRDIDDRLLFWNKAAEKLYGWTFEEARLFDVHRLIAEDDRLKYEKYMKEFLQKGEWEGELRQSTKDGRLLMTYSRWTLVRDKNGKPSARLIITRDITEQRALESQLRRTQRLENLGALAGGIAHDLNNVLAPILLAVQVMEKRTVDPQMREITSAIEKNVLRGRDIIKQVLLFARGGEEGFTPQQLRYIIDEMKSMMRETFPRNIALRVNVADDLKNIFGDATQLHQVLMNLCVNARDAMPDGGQLRIHASNLLVDKMNADMHDGMKPGEYILLSVADNGTGIPEEIQDKVFEPFFTTKEIGKGTGLGLSTVFSIIKNHKGFIKLFSEMGKGTEFKIYLPAVVGDEQVLATEELINIQPSQGETILLVDDESSILQISREALESYGYHVITAKNGTEALSTYAHKEKDSIQLVIMDLNMPLMDGIVAITALRKLDPKLKVILSSGKITDIDAPKLAQLNIQGTLVKPYTAKKMLETVWSVLHYI